MTKQEALKKIKELRDQINDVADPTGWVNAVLEKLDQAADIIEFPSIKQEGV